MIYRKDILDRFTVRTCLSRCKNSAAPFTAMADFLDELRCRGWDENTLRRTEAIVLESLENRDNLSSCNLHRSN